MNPNSSDQLDMPSNNRTVTELAELNGTALTLREWQDGDPGALLKQYLIQRYSSYYRKRPWLRHRIESRFDDFWHSYKTLYGSGFEHHVWVIRLFDLVLRGVRDRSSHLVALDIEREHNPDWFKSQKLVGGMLYVDLFAGDLRRLREKVPYLKELGINYLHLMPLLKNREGLNDGGYAVTSYREVDPRLGTFDELRKLARRLHEEGINLVLDFVMNHTAKEHRWAEAALAGDRRYQQYYYMFEDRRMPDAYEQHLIEVFPDFAPGNFTYYPQMDKWAWTTFHDFQWDLNYANPEVFIAMLEEMIYMANSGADFLRLDAVPYLWKKMGTVSQNLEEAHHLLRAYRALMDIVAPAVMFKAEAIVSPDQIIRYLGTGGYEGKECDVAYNATLMNHLWHALACENTHLLRTTLRKLPDIPQQATWINYIRSHDDIGWGISDENAAAVHQDGHQTRLFCTRFYTGRTPDSYAEGYPFQRDYWTGEARVSGTAASLCGLQKAQVEADELATDDAIQRLLLLNNVIFTWKGIPVIYLGDEVGQTNNFDYLADPLKKHDNRWVHRPPMNWAKADMRYVPGTGEHTIYEEMKELVRARQQTPALHGNSSDHILPVDRDPVFAFERSTSEQQLLCLSNFSRRPVHVPLHMLPERWRHPYFRDEFRKRVLHFSFQEIVLEPYNFLWLTPSRKRPSRKAENTIIDVVTEAGPGENIYIVGNLKELGAWNPKKAVGPMDSSAYPTWELQLELPANTYFEFQWLKMKNGRIVEWAPDKYWMKSGDEIFYV